MKRKSKVVFTANGLMDEMKKHSCKKKAWQADDTGDGDDMSVRYSCAGCGFTVGMSVSDLRRDRDALMTFWKSLRTVKGRRNIGKSFE